MKISACLIVKNEKDHIETVLESIRGIDEIIVVDTGSTDNTVELAKKYTERVFNDFAWCDDFAAARNHALAKCTGDWILSIDGDEILEQGGVQKIRELLESVREGEKTFSVRMKGAGVDNIHFLPRIFKNDGIVKWVGAAHETLSVVQDNKVDILIEYGSSTAHQLDPDRMLRILEKEIAKQSVPRDHYYLGREYYYRGRWKDAIETFKHYIEIAIWLPEKTDAYVYLARCLFFDGQGEEARKACLQAIAHNPDFKEALYLMAELHAEPWKRKWHKLAEVATNEDVLFIRQLN